MPQPELEPIHTSAPVKLVLSPDWEQPGEWVPVVAEYLGAPADGTHALCLDATSSAVSAGDIYETVSAICTTIVGDAPFGEIIILDVPFERTGTVAVASVADLRQRLGVPAGIDGTEPRGEPS